MITLDENKKYFILIDGQGLTFGGGAIYESIEEVINCFREWADNDDINIVGWTRFIITVTPYQLASWLVL